ncbi:uncharacterized protein Dvir_GJ17458, isoform C [Drosophila virilis]|uniref:Uncharacterized protein, isoform C n=1 Tax=Drosophila virilis TaxID=7244 RepID=A0A0Q9WL43_DROVI|nr:uncharacterized protein Dvir_GJ17458, isoform C [Drosophila virilis]
MSHLPLDARAILQHLNELGYRNISAEQLREFLKDLRRLIKYEERLATNSKEDYFSSLHKRDTISSRAKMGDREKENVPQQIDKDKTKQQASDDDKERLNSGKAATDNNLKLATLFREKLLLDESKEPSNSSNCARRSRSKTRNGPSRIEACPNQDTRIPRQSKLRKSRPRSNSRLSAQG